MGLLPSALAVACAISATALPAQVPAGVRLVEVASYSVPSGLEVSGAALSESGSVVFWSRESKLVMTTDGRRLQTLCLGQSLDPLAATFIGEPSRIEIIDGRSGRIVRTGPRNTCRFGAELGRPGTIVAATYSRQRDEWIDLTNRNGKTALVIAGGGQRRYVAIPIVPVTELAMTHITGSPHGVVMSSLKPPFAWTSVSMAGRTLARGRPFTGDTLIVGVSDTAASSELVGMATRAIDSTYSLHRSGR